MNIVEDIKKITKNDKEHRITIKAAWDGITVYLEYDPESDFNENLIIPIFCDAIDEICYIPNTELREKWNPSDYGIDHTEICLIKEIMDYFTEHMKEIVKLCYALDISDKSEGEIE